MDGIESYTVSLETQSAEVITKPMDNESGGEGPSGEGPSGEGPSGEGPSGLPGGLAPPAHPPSFESVLERIRKTGKEVKGGWCDGEEMKI